MKKGFTLIELLAIIVILAIIAIIASPIVINIIHDAKQNTEEKTTRFYIDAFNNSLAKNQLKGRH